MFSFVYILCTWASPLLFNKLLLIKKVVSWPTLFKVIGHCYINESTMIHIRKEYADIEVNSSASKNAVLDMEALRKVQSANSLFM